MHWIRENRIFLLGGLGGLVFLVGSIFLFHLLEYPTAPLYTLVGVYLGWLLSEVSKLLEQKKNQRKLVRALHNELVINKRIINNRASTIFLANELNGIKKFVFNRMLTEGGFVGIDSEIQDSVYAAYHAIEKLEARDYTITDKEAIEAIGSAILSIKRII